ncbi:DUF1707 domain-containing protein [Actinoplanes sp. NPDC049265]|uniref:DUF1707 SHOCT-like domain-containing protein n=1 Tax=Actinoplanes sp. NPDC049265 TaxID=3363902 RepID=UPI00371B1BCF
MDRAEMRAGDGDREATAARLKQALDDGRLDLHEYDERLQRAFAAKTYADLDGLTADLPGTVPPARSRIQPATSAPVAESADPGRGGATWVKGYAGVVAVCVVIWAITSLSSGHFIYFWPVWMLIPLIFGIVGNASGRRDRRGRRR